MSDFDQAARYATKQLDPPGLFRWMLGPSFLDAWRWEGWLDTQAVPFPGERDRRCDTVARFERLAHDAPPLAVVIEFMSETRRVTPERVLEYGLILRRELPYQTDPRVEYSVIGAIVNLTGSEQGEEWSERPPDCDGLGLWTRARVVNLAHRDAGEALTAVASGELGRAVLPWVPLMRGAGEAALVAEWRRLAEAEPDERKRADYGGLARVFAILARRADVWNQGLEGYNVERASIFLEWEARGELRKARADLLRALELRFKTAVPPEVARAVQAQADQTTLNHWFDLALTADSLDQVRAAFGLNGA